MNAATLTTFAPDREAGAQRCFHCGADCAGRAHLESIDGTLHAFCCQGCSAAAAWIARSGLEAYYALRTAPAGTAPRVESRVDPAAWDDEDVIAPHTRGVRGGREIVLVADGMHCAACAWLIERAMVREPGVLEATANAVTGRVRVAWKPAERRLSDLMAVVTRLGYAPHLAAGVETEDARDRERNRWLLRTGIAALASVQTMMFAEALYFDSAGGMPEATRDFLRWIALLVSTPVVFYSGWPLLHGAWRELALRRPGMDTLVSTSVLLAFVASAVETVRGGTQVWFDAVVMFVLLLLVGRFLEQRVRARSRARLDALARGQPPVALRLGADGEPCTVPVSRLRPGDTCLVPAGSTVPADGTLRDGEASFNEALLTGEPLPMQRRAGEAILAGAICVQGPARFIVTHSGGATRLAGIVRLAEAAQLERPRLARLADRVAAGFVVALLAGSAIAYLAWRSIDPSRAFEVTLALLVISCPCALSLAVPAALAAAHETLLRWGVLPASADALESLSRVTDVVFDKTGTLTIGRGELVACTPCDAGDDPGRMLRLAASLAAHSTHPHGAALRAACGGDILPVSDVREHRGQGLQGVAAGSELRIGTAPFATGAAAPDDFLWLGDGRRPLARFELRDTLRPEARAIVDSLQARGITPHVFSGDGDASVARCAAELGIADARSRQSPEAKLAAVRDLQRQGRRVAVVGDGINDAPVLAGADVSIAIGSGADLAQRAADLVWTRRSLEGLPDLFSLARRADRVIRSNFAWALGYNVVAIPLAATGHVTPWIAALAMVVSSLTVTLNALRLAREPRP